MYREGVGVHQNNAGAFKWWRKAAAQGNEHAENNMGQDYHDGAGRKRNYGFLYAKVRNAT
jgi:TPR repeat protein